MSDRGRGGTGGQRKKKEGGGGGGEGGRTHRWREFAISNFSERKVQMIAVTTAESAAVMMCSRAWLFVIGSHQVGKPVISVAMPSEKQIQAGKASPPSEKTTEQIVMSWAQSTMSRKRMAANAPKNGAAHTPDSMSSIELIVALMCSLSAAKSRRCARWSCSFW